MPGEAKQQLKQATQDRAEWKEGYNPDVHAHKPAFKAAGRVGEPKLELGEEPRVHAQLLPALKAFGMGTHATSPDLDKLDENASPEDIAELVGRWEEGLIMMYEGAAKGFPEDANETKVQQTQETIKGGDGQDLLMYIYHPADQTGPLPGVCYIHGGGMIFNPTMNPVHDRWCRAIAAKGCVVVMVDFRNVYTKTGLNHFPKGLDDCVAGVKWTIANKDKLKIRNLVLQGESGGANLSLATALTANREGWIKDIAGVYAIVPYISNAWGWPEEKLLKELPSVIECNGYFLERQTNAFFANFYTPKDEDQTNPLAWPYHATLDEMKGLPPHNLVMDELDPLRDEGISYFRRLAQAGVDVKGGVNLGVTHGSSLIFRNVVPAYTKSAVRDIAAFASEL